jgi:ubiquinone/menaquinone biosynthesis C-methylase UbiE
MEVDMTKPKGYVDSAYLEASGKATLPNKQKSYALMQIKAGHKVLDVGCGSGFDTVNLSSLVQASGQVIGIDFDEEMIIRADKYAEAAGVKDRVLHRYADALQLPFETNVFDSCRSERLFQHLVEPERALSEMVRVTKPGGWIVVMDTDWGTLSADTTEPDIANKLWHFKATNLENNGFSGRKLYRLFKQQGLMGIIVEPYVNYATDYSFGRWMIQADELEQLALSTGEFSVDELEKLNTGLEQANKLGLYFGTLGGVIVAGCKPS